MRLSEQSVATGKSYPARMVLYIAGLSSAAWYTSSRAKISKQRPDPSRSSAMKNWYWLFERIWQPVRSTVKDTRKSALDCAGRACVLQETVLRLMKANNLLAQCAQMQWFQSSHDGKIVTEHPNRMWGTDGKQFWTRQNGLCWFFGTIDHWNDEILGWHTSIIGDRFAALEPVHQAVLKEYGSLNKGVVQDIGLSLRSDHGSQYDSRDFQTELKYLGLMHSPAFVRSPECNGIIERFNRTLEEQVLMSIASSRLMRRVR